MLLLKTYKIFTIFGVCYNGLTALIVTHIKIFKKPCIGIEYRRSSNVVFSSFAGLFSSVCFYTPLSSTPCYVHDKGVIKSCTLTSWLLVRVNPVATDGVQLGCFSGGFFFFLSLLILVVSSVLFVSFLFLLK